MRSSSGLTVIASDRFRAKSQHRERAARPDRAPLVSPADARDAPALLPPRRARDLFRPKARPHSDADVPSRKQRGPFLFARSTERSAACPPSTSRPANPALLHLGIMAGLPARPLRPRQPATFFRSAIASRSIQPRDQPSAGQ